jgi:hypothetical protein
VRAAIGLAILALLAGCAFSSRVVTPRTAWEQILATEAIDRAAQQLEWPDLTERRVYVRVAPPDDALDENYLRGRLEVIAAQRGALVVRERGAADLELACLVGAMGIDTSGRFMGIEGSAGGFVPFTIPELMLYRRTLREGFAKAEIALVEVETGGLVHRSGPVEGTARRTHTTVFFVFHFSDGDVERLE